MTYVMVDVETDGPVPGLYSMISLGAIVVDDTLDKTFYAEFHPISNNFQPEALAVSSHTRQETLNFPHHSIGITMFDAWLKSIKRPMFVSDNNGFDWQFVNYYLWLVLNRNPFGFSSTNLGSFYKGIQRDLFSSFKHLRRTKHTHHPVDDARGNAEAFITMAREAGIKLPGVTTE